MWLLRNEEKGLIFRIQPGKPNVVSRKDGDLLLLGDQSISRKHAELLVHNENQNGGIVLKDLGSKYGTFKVLQGGQFTQVPPNQPLTLNNGDSLRFGIQWNLWRVEYFPLVVATSTLNVGEKMEVKTVVAALGGELVNDWQPCCTHLTMNKLTVTVKVVCALASSKFIVLPAYWKALKDALASTQTKLPDCQNFVPPLAEALLNPSEVSFAPRQERGQLFRGYTFVAASARQLTRIQPMITAAGGRAVEFSASLWPDSKLMQAKTVLMQHSPADKQGSQQSQVLDGYITAARKLKAAGVRCVPESEIGLSILYCSLSQYCNPRYSPQSLFGASTPQNTQQITVICPDTEESLKTQPTGVKSKSTSSKRALENSTEEEQHPSKRRNSEDIFSSPCVESKTNRNSNTLASKTSVTKEKPSHVNPSLDMFAPSGQISGQSDQNKNTFNKTKSNIENNDKEKPLAAYPSLDMFAPSGQITKKDKNKEIDPSCQEGMFATNGDRQTLEKKRTNSNQSASVSNKQPKLALANEEDDFSFTTSRKCSKPQKAVEEKDDEFSFSSRRSNKGRVVDQDDGDEFSFASNRKRNHQKIPENQDDLFSFVSAKNSKKRNHQSISDTFVFNAECSTSNDKASGSSKKNNCNVTSVESEESDDLFTFAGNPAAKRRKNNENCLNMGEPEAEVKLALFSKKDNPSSGPSNSCAPTLLDNPPEEKHLTTYTKDKPCLLNIKEEVKDEEVDELAKELYNATIVVVKPLLVVREKPTEAQKTSSGKNFKKFQKVTGINKRTVPHIIGGSDLVPHYANCQNIDDVLPPSPPIPLSPDDDWGFPKEKKKYKNQ